MTTAATYGSQGGPGMLLQLAVLVGTLVAVFLLGWLVRGLRESDCQCGGGDATLRRDRGRRDSAAPALTTAPSADYRSGTGLHAYDTQFSNPQ